MRSTPPSRRALRWARDFALLAMVVVAFQWWQSKNLIAGKAPPLVGLLSDGSPWQLDPAAGPHLVHFWASWCPTCRFEQGGIERIAGSWPVITIATRSGSASEVTAYLKEHDLRMPVLMDEHGEIAETWGVDGVPASFVIDRAGQVRYAGQGFSSEIGLRLRLWSVH